MNCENGEFDMANGYLRALLEDKVALSILFICVGATGLLLILPEGGVSNIMGNMTGLLSLVLGTVFSFLAFRLYGSRSIEGKVWLIFMIGFLLCTIGILMVTMYERGMDIELLKYGLSYLRTIGYVFFIIGMVLKLRHAGIKMDIRSYSITTMFMLSWLLMIVLFSIWPGMIEVDSYSVVENPYVLLSIADIFILLVAVLVIQMDVMAKGWIAIAWGMFLISIGDTFYTVMLEYVDAHGGYWDGHPYHMLWYVGLYLIAFGAYYQRKVHKALIDM